MPSRLKDFLTSVQGIIVALTGVVLAIAGLISAWERLVPSDPKQSPAHWKAGGVDEDAPAEVFQHCDYSGNMMKLKEGDNTWGEIDAEGLNDEISSIKILPGYKVTLYEHNFWGEKAVLEESEDCFVGNWYNDDVSSIKVERE